MLNRLKVLKTILLVGCVVIWGGLWILSAALHNNLPHAFLPISRFTFIMFVILLLVDTKISFEISFNDKKNDK